MTVHSYRNSGAELSKAKVAPEFGTTGDIIAQPPNPGKRPPEFFADQLLWITSRSDASQCNVPFQEEL